MVRIAIGGVCVCCACELLSRTINPHVVLDYHHRLFGIVLRTACTEDGVGVRCVVRHRVLGIHACQNYLNIAELYIALYLVYNSVSGFQV